MKKQLYFKATHSRSNPFKAYLLLFFTMFSAPSRNICETFSRSQFGERYYSFAWAIIYLIALLPMPVFKYAISYHSFSFGKFLLHDLSWYVFLVAFIYKAYHHWKANWRPASTFDFTRYTLSTGILDKRFFKLTYKGKPFDMRFIETIIEPGLFFFIGLGLILLTQTVGFLILISSIAYSASRFLDYHYGDELVMDHIDMMIIHEGYRDAFVEDEMPENTKGFQFRGVKPKSRDSREKAANSLFNDEDEDTSYAV